MGYRASNTGTESLMMALSPNVCNDQCDECENDAAQPR